MFKNNCQLTLLANFTISAFLRPRENVDSKKCWVDSNQIWVKYGQTQMLG